MNIFFNKLRTRLKTCYRILFCKYNHWVLFDLSDDDLTNLLSNKPYDLDIMYHGIQPYIYKKIAKDFADSIDSIEFLCDKAKFEADSIDYKKQ